MAADKYSGVMRPVDAAIKEIDRQIERAKESIRGFETRQQRGTVLKPGERKEYEQIKKNLQRLIQTRDQGSSER
jgi:hypothetical protein